jgi:hypothetical protein
MAIEVKEDKPYHTKADVYSFNSWEFIQVWTQTVSSVIFPLNIHFMFVFSSDLLKLKMI